MIYFVLLQSTITLTQIIVLPDLELFSSECIRLVLFSEGTTYTFSNGQCVGYISQIHLP